MTKKEMIDYIETSGMVINFSRSYFNKMLRERVEEFYDQAVRFCNKWEGQPSHFFCLLLALANGRWSPNFTTLKC